MFTVGHYIWNFGIDLMIRKVETKEQSEEFINAANELQPGQVYRMLQRIRTYFMTPHNGKPLTNLQSNTLISYHTAVKKLIL